MTIKMTIKKNIKISIWIFVILMLSVLSIMQPLSNADNMKENLANNTRGASIGLEEIVEREYFIKNVYSGQYFQQENLRMVQMYNNMNIMEQILKDG